MSAAAYASEARDLLVKLEALAADAQLRALLLRRKCEELERTLRVARTQHERRAARAEAADAETQQLSESLEDAIRRARQVRVSLATASGDDGDCDDEAEEGEKEADGGLQNILAMAKSIRALDANVAATTTPPKPQEAAPKPQQVRLEYPRRLKALLEQLREADEREAVESFRFAFCRRLSERLGRVRGGGGDDFDARGRVHVGYKKQAARLQHAHQLLEAFVAERVGVGSERFELALRSPTLGAVFPIYERAQQGKRMLRLLSEETREFDARTPAPPPRLSREAVAHRDATLRRIASTKTAAKPEGVIGNAALAASPLFAAHASTLERLQTAWEASLEPETSDAPDSSAFEATLREVVLVDTSNLVLAFFKAIFCDHPDDPTDPEHVTNMLLLLRLVDSVAMQNGRKLRSVVAFDHHQPAA